MLYNTVCGCVSRAPVTVLIDKPQYDRWSVCLLVHTETATQVHLIPGLFGYILVVEWPSQHQLLVRQLLQWLQTVGIFRLMSPSPPFYSFRKRNFFILVETKYYCQIQYLNTAGWKLRSNRVGAAVGTEKPRLCINTDDNGHRHGTPVTGLYHPKGLSSPKQIAFILSCGRVTGLFCCTESDESNETGK